ncbi:MAG TPA: phosphoribosylamine--glycine ligase [Candidatus Omnitrophota bacterium]|jgi:phosphoribosylamine--glycine ligase|nr:phosphoribosylamine--glycine ligase [Candidatus Omnitrophota bacterium]
MNILIVGSGGREHALAWKISQSPKVKKIFCAPGNGGIAQIAECVDIASDDIAGLAQFAQKHSIDLTIVGPEAPLAAGIVDEFQSKGLKVFGPNRLAAQLEGSKVFAKEFMHRHGIPTASFMSFDSISEAREFLQETQFPLVIKADGLASGKGVFVCYTIDEALNGLKEIEEHMAEAGKRILVEECLRGEEASILAISDGERYVVLESSQDHKRIFDDDLGPNTGGMGAYSPAPVVNDLMLAKIETQIIEPVIRGMVMDKMPFQGVLYAGLMITDEGPMVLEFNARFGDPETQAVLPRLKTDLLEVILAACERRIDQVDLEWDRRACVCVVMSAGGYPGSYEKGMVIHGLEKAAASGDGIVFHAGTKRHGGAVVTSGGRVLGVTALGEGIEGAIANAYKIVDMIRFDHCFFRRDIGAKALKRIEQKTI